MDRREATAPGVSARLVLRGLDGATAGFRMIPVSAVVLLARLSMASVFWTSGRTKVEPGTLFTLSDSAVQLFRDEYGISLFTPAIAAELAMVSEHIFPLMLVLGLASRFAALALLVMTLVIEIFVYPEAYDVHGPWAVCLLIIMKQGGGLMSLDFWVVRWWSGDVSRGVETRPAA